MPAQDLDEESSAWLRRLGAAGAERRAAERELHARLVRIALAEVRRRAAGTPVAGRELDDVAHQAADDAMVAVLAELADYRGAWCPYCNAQLRAFERAGQALRDNGIRVVALSVDDKETTAALVARHKLTFPVGHGADAASVAALTGAFVNPDPVYLQSAGFVLDPGGKVIVGVYSSGAIGRLVPDDVIGLVRYLREHPAPATA